MFIIDQVIRTGFEKIRHNIAFQPQTEPKGKALVESAYLEHNAKDEYEKRYKISVIQLASVIVCASQPWLCASLNGAVVRDGAIERILEMKCPDPCKNLPAIDEETQKVNINYLELINGSYCITVYRDENFLEDVVHKCEEFYFTNYLPALYNLMQKKCDINNSSVSSKN
ncbi:hypothetical protein PV328_004030 [Microctonus aethiopoides]|uniref:YqaJ viral recombinase domain-containing protein n=1 Tax=Microctonus aethiopoides TaxID=144406 RepID=A0AA39F9S8_9HYME|nr:hypothetical protein PV328_004030 [Microctonus aethiopoides]